MPYLCAAACCSFPPVRLDVMSSCTHIYDVAHQNSHHQSATHIHTHGHAPPKHNNNNCTFTKPHTPLIGRQTANSLTYQRSHQSRTWEIPARIPAIHTCGLLSRRECRRQYPPRFRNACCVKHCEEGRNKSAFVVVVEMPASEGCEMRRNGQEARCHMFDSQGGGIARADAIW